MVEIKVINGLIYMQQDISSKLFMPTGNTLVCVRCTPSYKSEITPFEDMICEYLNKQSLDEVPIFTDHVTPSQSIETKEDGVYIKEVFFQVYLNDSRLI